VGGAPLPGDVVPPGRPVAPADLAVARDLAVRQRLVGFVRVHPGGAEQPRLEKRASIKQALDPLARVEHARFLSLGELFRSAHPEPFGPPLFLLSYPPPASHLFYAPS